ncbi:MAG: DUF4943 family protein [Bacteroidota bacterium]
MRRIIYTLLLSSLLLACSEPISTKVDVLVQDKHNTQPLDSSKVYLYSQYQDQTKMVIDSQFTDLEGSANFSFVAQEGLKYSVSAERRHYQASVNNSGSAYENQQSVDPDMINTLYLYLELIPPPDPDRFEKMHAQVSVNEVIAAIKDTAWEWAFLPHLEWEDIPALLAVGGDTTIIEDYPKHPLSTYRPKSARVGLVALWLVEAIRRMEVKGGDLAGNLMPPSRTPILGTRRGNPSGYNSPKQIETAHQAYTAWWEAAQAKEDRQKAARDNPLLGKGLSWM